MNVEFNDELVYGEPQLGNNADEGSYCEEPRTCKEVLDRVDAASDVRAAHYQKARCLVHEVDCDGTCSTVVQPDLETWQREGPKGCVKITPAGPADRPEGPHNQAWISSQNLCNFGYDRLPLNKIRLLQIHTAIYREDVVECEMIESDLWPSTEYAALSYVWGPPIFDRTMICNGKIFRITSNLEAALKTYRIPSSTMSDRDRAFGDIRGSKGSAYRSPYLWVDAVCIDQSSPVEVDRHLLIMADIYRGAKRVYVALGDAAEDWFPGHDLLYRFRGLLENFNITQARGVRTEIDLTHYGLPPRKHLAWRLLFSLFESDWFTRTWVIQELSFSTQATFLFGKYDFDWLVLMCCMKWLRHHRIDMDLMRDLSEKGRRGFQNAFTILTLEDMIRKSENRTPLNILSSTKDFYVSNLKDKILAVWSLIDSNSSLTKDLFTPSSCLSLRSLLQSFASLTLHTDGLTMLEYAGLQLSGPWVQGLPSWVPDWTAMSVKTEIHPMSRILLPEYDVGRHCPPEYGTNSGKLFVRGMRIDKIGVLCRKPTSNGNKGEAFLQMHDQAMEIINAMLRRVESDSDKEAILEAFRRTLIANNLLPWNDDPKAIVPPIRSLGSTYENALECLRKKFDLSVYRQNSPVVSFFAAASQVCSTRSFALTESGRFAMVPHCSRSGDSIVALGGMRAPFVFRNEQSSLWKLIGDAYVHRDSAELDLKTSRGTWRKITVV